MKKQSYQRILAVLISLMILLTAGMAIVGAGLLQTREDSPDILPEAEKQAGFRFDLALCGHTHGGQLVVFGRSLHSSSAYGDTYARGWMDAHGGKLLVTHGVGTSLLPMRLGVRPQIHRITLKRK